MVLRTSNGYPFIVLAPEAAVRTGIRVEIYERTDPDTIIDVLPDTRNREWLDELNAAGSGSFDIAANDPKLLANPGILSYGNVVRFYLNNILRAAFRIEAIDRAQAQPPGDSRRWLTVSGRGPLSILEDGVAYPQGGLTGNPNRGFPGITAGHLMRVLLEEWQARGGGAGVTWSFTDTLDSYSAPYAQTLNVVERAGINLLRLANRHSALAVDVYMAPSLRLNYYNTRGVDKTITTGDTGAVTIQIGYNILELTNEETGRITNLLLIETPAGYQERNRGGSITSHGRREGFLSLGNVSDSSTIDLAAEAAFARTAEPTGSATLEIIEAPGSMPYEDFDVGDWVLAPNSQGVLEKVRVRSIAVSETPAGRVRYIPQLASVEEELEARLNRWLESMAKGTLGGSTADIAEPNTVSGTVVTETVDAGITTHVASFGHPDELGDLADVDPTGVGDEDLLTYDNVGGLWVPISRPDFDAADLGSGAASSGRLLTADGAGGAAWQPAPGGASTPAWLSNAWDRLVTRPDSPTSYDDEMDAASGGLDAKWTLVTVSGGQTINHLGDGRLQLTLDQTIGAAQANAALQSLSPLTPPVTIEMAVRHHVIGAQYHMFGPIFTDGVTAGANIVYLMPYQTTNAGLLTWSHRAGTLNAIAGSSFITERLIGGSGGQLLYIRLVWVSANTWLGYASWDGKVWFSWWLSAGARTLTPTHFGFAWTNWGSLVGGISLIDYWRVNPTA